MTNIRRYVVRVVTRNDTSLFLRNMLIFTRRKVRITDVNFDEHEKEDLLRTDILFEAEPHMAENITKQLTRQIDVLEAVLVKREDVVVMERQFVSVDTPTDTDRERLKEVCADHHAAVKSYGTVSVVEFDMEGRSSEGLMADLGNFEVLDVIRSGKMVISKQRSEKEVKFLNH